MDQSLFSYKDNYSDICYLSTVSFITNHETSYDPNGNCTEKTTNTLNLGHRRYCDGRGFIVIESLMLTWIIVPHPAGGCVVTQITTIEHIHTTEYCPPADEPINEDTTGSTDPDAWKEAHVPYPPIVTDPENPNKPPPEYPQTTTRSPFPFNSCDELNDSLIEYHVACEEDETISVTRIIYLTIARQVKDNPIECLIIENKFEEKIPTNIPCFFDDPLDPDYFWTPDGFRTAEEVWMKTLKDIIDKANEEQPEEKKSEKVSLGEENRARSGFEDAIYDIHKKEVSEGIKKIPEPRLIYVKNVNDKPATRENILSVNLNERITFDIGVEGSEFSSKVSFSGFTKNTKPKEPNKKQTKRSKPKRRKTNAR